jgi:hypothetical protein
MLFQPVYALSGKTGSRTSQHYESQLNAERGVYVGHAVLTFQPTLHHEPVESGKDTASSTHERSVAPQRCSPGIESPMFKGAVAAASKLSLISAVVFSI